MHTAETKIKKALDILAEKITSNTRAEEAVRFSQAALNFAETLKIIQDKPSCNNCSGGIEPRTKKEPELLGE